MKTLVCLLALLVGSLHAEAANINQGNTEIGSTVALSQTWSGGSSSTIFILSGSGQYFFQDLLSAGAELSFVSGSGFSSYSIGPVASYYFAVQDQMAPYVMVKPIELSDSSLSKVNLSSSLRLGVKFFLTDSVAFGPALQYEHTWKTNRVNSIDNVSLLAQFAVHL